MDAARNLVGKLFHGRLRADRARSSRVALNAPTVRVELDASVQSLWDARIVQTVQDTYLGVALWKMPEDLKVYEHLLELTRPNVVIEIGTNDGGSALWFRDRLRTLAAYGWISDPLVISIDLSVEQTSARLSAVDPHFSSAIKLIAADVRDPGLPARVGAMLPPGASCMVVDDSGHTYETTSAALRGFAQFVPRNGFFVVEDGIVDIEAMRPVEEWPRGVLPALSDWLASEAGRGFVSRRDFELYGLTCNPEGYLQRVR